MDAKIDGDTITVTMSTAEALVAAQELVASGAAAPLLGLLRQQVLASMTPLPPAIAVPAPPPMPPPASTEREPPI